MISKDETQREKCINAVNNVDFPGLLKEYQNAVYDDPTVETIYHQTFLANEYQLMAIAAQTVILAACAP